EDLVIREGFPWLHLGDDLPENDAIAVDVARRSKTWSFIQIGLEAFGGGPTDVLVDVDGGRSCAAITASFEVADLGLVSAFQDDIAGGDRFVNELSAVQVGKTGGNFCGNDPFGSPVDALFSRLRLIKVVA